MAKSKDKGKGFKLRRIKWKLVLLRTTTAVCLTVGWFYFANSIPGQQYEGKLTDTLVRLRGALPSPDEVVVVALDEGTYRALDLPMDRPIPREKHGKMLKRLAELGAKRVVFDIVFAGESAVPEGDRELAEGVGSLPVVLAVDHGTSESGGMVVNELIKPEPFLTEKAHGLALVGMRLDDGSARHFFFNNAENLQQFVTLSEAGAGMIKPELRTKFARPAPRDLINFYGPSRTVKTISLYQILEEEVPIPAHHVRGKVVYVGLVLRTGLGAMQKDSFQTPFGDIFGVEIHATQAANMMAGDWIRRPAAHNEYLVGTSMLFLSVMLVLGVKPFLAIAFTIAMVCGWAVAAFVALKMNFFLIGGTAVTTAIPLAALINVSYWYVVTRRKQRDIEKAFAFYLSPAMVSELKRNPGLLKLGGDEIVASAMFTDIAGFTTISEQLGPQGVVAMLNAYFSEVTKAVLEEGGTVIKFIGDAVFALWGAPLPQEDHAQRAIRAALRIQDTVEAFNKRGIFPPLITRVGVNSAKMVVGNLGSDSRFDYTAIGDSVNLASRVEALNKYLGSTVLITQDAVNESNGAPGFHLLRMGAIKVKGKELPVKLYRLFSNPVPEDLRRAWEEVLTAFEERKFGEAKDQFTAIGQKHTELTIVTEFYRDVISEFEARPPEESWRGEVTMDHK